jgi:hypothetical protein
MDLDGILMCARYAASPNFFGYCGPDKSKNVQQHLLEDTSDAELKDILSEFETLYPYLCLISQENNLGDPFDLRVVEAYWLGNGLLKKVSCRRYWHFLDKTLLLGKKLSSKEHFLTKDKLRTFYLLPHHNSHVFNIFRRTGKIPINHTLKSMDNCRIGWGKIKTVNDQGLVKIKSRYLKWDKFLYLGDNWVETEIKSGYQNKRFVQSLKPGDWVSFHWGYLCDRITLRQAKNLAYYTRWAINYFNAGI